MASLRWTPCSDQQSGLCHDGVSLMDALEADKILLFVFCVVPGFVALKAYETMSGWRLGDTSRQLMDALTYSFANYVVCAFPVWWMHQHDVPKEHPFWYGLFWLFTVLILPVSLSLGFWKLRTSSFMQSSFPHPVGRAWDYFFSKRTQHWVIVTLKDGRQFAGRYGVRSFSSSAPHPEQLYLEEAWKLNDAGGCSRSSTATRRSTTGCATACRSSGSRRMGARPVLRARVIDADGKNDLLAVQQFTVHGQKIRRPDVVLFVNGLPLVVIELKNPPTSTRTSRRPTTRSRPTRPTFRSCSIFNLLNVISDGTVARYGSLTADLAGTRAGACWAARRSAKGSSSWRC
jgi:hypothetical protein